MGLGHAKRLFALQTLVGEILASSGMNGCPEDLAVGDQDMLPRAEDEVARRKLRQTRFGGLDIFSDPAWDILLELYVADKSGKRLSVSSLGLETKIAPSTALRWLGLLENMRLIERTHDPDDRRRTWISLTPEGSETMRSLFRS